MSPPLFRFLCGSGRDADARPMWPGSGLPFDGDVAPDGSWVTWRLTASNHWELGRSIRVYPDVGVARVAALLIKDNLDRAKIQTRASAPGGTWTWRMLIDDEPVAVSGRGYARQRECAYAVTAFTASVAEAELSETVAGFRSEIATPWPPFPTAGLTIGDDDSTHRYAGVVGAGIPGQMNGRLTPDDRPTTPRPDRRGSPALAHSVAEKAPVMPWEDL